MTWELVVFTLTKGIVLGFIVTTLLRYNKYTRLIVYGGLFASALIIFVYPVEVLATPTVFSNWEMAIAYVLGIFIGTALGRSSVEEIKKDWQCHSSNQKVTDE